MKLDISDRPTGPTLAPHVEVTKYSENRHKAQRAFVTTVMALPRHGVLRLGCLIMMLGVCNKIHVNVALLGSRNLYKSCSIIVLLAALYLWTI